MLWSSEWVVCEELEIQNKSQKGAFLQLKHTLHWGKKQTCCKKKLLQSLQEVVKSAAGRVLLHQWLSCNIILLIAHGTVLFSAGLGMLDRGICPTKDRWLPRNYKILIKRLYKPDKQTKKWLLEIEKSGENDSIMTHLTEWHTRDWKKCLNDCCHRFVDGIVQCRQFSRSHVQSVRIKA